MSHRSTCPTEWDARREGERAGYSGFGGNPYRDTLWIEDACPEAERAWRSGHYLGEERRQEEEYQEALDRRRAREAKEERLQEEERYEDMEQRYEPEPIYEGGQEE